MMLCAGCSKLPLRKLRFVVRCLALLLVFEIHGYATTLVVSFVFYDTLPFLQRRALKAIGVFLQSEENH